MYVDALEAVIYSLYTLKRENCGAERETMYRDTDLSCGAALEGCHLLRSDGDKANPCSYCALCSKC